MASWQSNTTRCSKTQQTQGPKHAASTGYHPRCFLNASWADIPFMTSSLTRSSAATRSGRIETTSAIFPFGMMTTPLLGSQNAKSPGWMSVPSMFNATWTAWGLDSAPAPTIDVPRDHIYGTRQQNSEIDGSIIDNLIVVIRWSWRRVKGSMRGSTRTLKA